MSYFKKIMLQYQNLKKVFSVEIPDNFGGSYLIFESEDLQQIQKFIDNWTDPNYKTVDSKEFLEIHLLIYDDDDIIIDNEQFTYDELFN